jgi:hypothetical protein
MMDLAWRGFKRILGFGEVGSPLAVKVAEIQADMNWLKRGFWLLLSAIIIRPFLN